MKKVKMFIVIFCLIIFSVSLTVAATDSIVGDFFNPVFTIKPTDGTTFLESLESQANREKTNDEILDEVANGEYAEKYSLFDRFGADINYIPYHGEIRITTTLADEFYTKWKNMDGEFKLKISDIKSLFAKSSKSNNTVYKNRPPIISSSDIKSGSMDSRVYQYPGITVGSDADVGNFNLKFSIFMSSFAAFVSGSDIYKLINELINFIFDNGGKEVIKAISTTVLPVVLIAFVFYLVKSSFNIIKGTLVLRTFLSNIIVVFIALGFIFYISRNPTSLNDSLLSVVSFVDNIFDEQLNVNGSEIVQSSVNDNVREASLWEKSVFEYWCKGMFNRPYSEMYTNYSLEGVKYPQSNDDIFEEWTGEEIRYNSTILTGNINVPLGGGINSKNWAALAWSCQSKYHIDAIQPVYVNGSWPKATTTPQNTDIFIDNFRWIDAFLDMSPEYTSDGNININYSNSKSYENWFYTNSIKSMFMGIMLIPIIMVGIKRVKISIKIAGASMQLFYYSFLQIFMPDSQSPIENLKKVFKNIYEYLWWSIIIYVVTILYLKYVGGNFIINVVYIIISIYLVFHKPINMPRAVVEITNRTKNTIGNLASKFRR